MFFLSLSFLLIKLLTGQLLFLFFFKLLTNFSYFPLIFIAKFGQVLQEGGWSYPDGVQYIHHTVYIFSGLYFFQQHLVPLLWDNEKQTFFIEA